MRPVILVLALLPVACGGGNKPAEAPTTESTETSASSGGSTTDKSDKSGEAPKPPSKYPAPFMEPDCTDAKPEGHLPDAKKAIAEVRKKNWERLHACAEAAPEGVSVSGEIRTTFRLDTDGVPRCVEAPGAPSNMEEVVRCVLSVYRTFRFPSPKGGSIRVTDGIHLQVSHEDEE